MSSAPRPRLAGAAVLATLAVGAVLTACSSGADEPAVPNGAAPHPAVAQTGPAATIDPVAHPADEADSTAIKTLMDEYVATTNAQDADGFRAVLCDALQPDYEGLENEAPVSDPMVAEGLADVAVDGDRATANFTYSLSQAADSPSQTSPFKFSRESGQWKVCGSPE